MSGVLHRVTRSLLFRVIFIKPDRVRYNSLVRRYPMSDTLQFNTDARAEHGRLVRTAIL